MSIQTFFAAPMRTSASGIAREVKQVAENSLVQELLKNIGGLVSVINKNRQILATNDQVLSLLKVPDIESILGKRPGEAFNCVHADETPNGCGTGECCRSCGAVLAIVACQLLGTPIEKDCALSRKSEEGADQALIFKVRASPLSMAGEDMTLLFMQDISAEKRREALEKTFFHDLRNRIMGISGMAEGLVAAADDNPDRAATRTLGEAVGTLADEVRVQEILMGKSEALKNNRKNVLPVARIVKETTRDITAHPSSKGRKLEVVNDCPEQSISTDKTLVSRVLTNMLINAFEATTRGETVKLSVAAESETVTFSVWNPEPIPQDFQPRIFQQFFSTKDTPGRGLGTYGMKLIGEQYLGGKVSFESSADTGTVFRFSLPAMATSA